MLSVRSILKIAALSLVITLESNTSFASDTAEISKEILDVASQIAKYETVDDNALAQVHN